MRRKWWQIIFGSARLSFSSTSFAAFTCGWSFSSPYVVLYYVSDCVCLYVQVITRTHSHTHATLTNRLQWASASRNFFFSFSSYFSLFRFHRFVCFIWQNVISRFLIILYALFILHYEDEYKQFDERRRENHFTEYHTRTARVTKRGRKGWRRREIIIIMFSDEQLFFSKSRKYEIIIIENLCSVYAVCCARCSIWSW